MKAPVTSPLQSSHYATICNQQMAFCRYHLKCLHDLSLLNLQTNSLQQRAQEQAACLALGLALCAYLNELKKILLPRQTGFIHDLQSLLEHCERHQCIAAEVVELNALADMGSSWLLEIEQQYLDIQSLCMTGSPSQQNRVTDQKSFEDLGEGLGESVGERLGEDLGRGSGKRFEGDLEEPLLIASNRVQVPILNYARLNDYWQRLDELITRQRINNVEC